MTNPYLSRAFYFVKSDAVFIERLMHL